MRLVIQIPCFNEEESIAQVIKEIPLNFQGIDSVIILIIDDGSTDHTIREVSSLSDNRIRILKMPRNSGLAAAFQSGIQESLRLDADIVVNTDGDGQYPASDIQALIDPILNGEVDLVIGDRQIREVVEFSNIKKYLQILGTRVTAWLANTKIEDATSGFRAYRSDVLASLYITSNFSYTLESIVQLRAIGARCVSVPINRRHTERPSRLFKSNYQYIRRNGATLLRTALKYRPIPVHGFFSLLFVSIAIVCWIPTLVNIFDPNSNISHLQSAILGGVFAMGAIVSLSIGILADSILHNRLMLHKLIAAERLSQADPNSILTCIP